MHKRLVFYNTYEPVVSIYRDLPPLLADANVQVDIVISRSQYRDREQSLKEYYESHYDSKTNLKVIEIGLGFRRPVTRRWQKIVVMASYYLCAFWEILLKKADLRVFLTQPPFFAAIGRLSAKARDEKYICIIMDLYPELLESSKLITANGVISRALQSIAIKTYQQASAIVTISHDMQKYISQHQLDKNTVHFIPNWAFTECDNILAHKNNKLRKELGFNSEDFIVLYSGNLGIAHYFDDILETAEEMKNILSLKFVFIGDGPRINEVYMAKKSRKLENVYTFDYQSSERLIESLSMADIHFISLREGFDRFSVPSKIVGALSVGRPIVFQSSKKGDISTMLSENACGSHINIGDKESLKNIISQYLLNPSLCLQHSTNSFNLYTSKFSRKTGLKNYMDIIKQSFGNNKV